MAWTRGRIFLKFSLVFKVLSLSHFFIKSNETTTLHTFHWCSIRMWNLKKIHWVLSEIWPGHEPGQTDSGQTEKLKPISPRFTMAKKSDQNYCLDCVFVWFCVFLLWFVLDQCSMNRSIRSKQAMLLRIVRLSNIVGLSDKVRLEYYIRQITKVCRTSVHDLSNIRLINFWTLRSWLELISIGHK